jgi:uncharacterized protein YdiU (UPF0061 family)
MVAGFVHGVLNTDNLNVTGESFDYGPWRFLSGYDPEFTAAYFDESGLYAYGRQPEAVLWNLARLSDALAPLGDVDPDALATFVPAYEEAYRAHALWRLGLVPRGVEADEALLAALIAFVEEARIPYDQVYFDAYGGEARIARALAGPFARVYQGSAFAPVRAAWAHHEPRAPERLSDPYLDRPGPVSMVITTVEGVWDPIARADDWSALERLVADVRELGRFLGAPPVIPRR